MGAIPEEVGVDDAVVPLRLEADSSSEPNTVRTSRALRITSGAALSQTVERVRIICDNNEEIIFAPADYARRLITTRSPFLDSS